ncbi:hypothetical protein [Caballeronia telluris]|uniref:Uncharacterized protein n=1 Tax=Caballeronia telluris TaxID=326475 RepID=A0A158KA81_9BURK|nr:hypothetical protein [Caballeronia telluris]SAL77361.1 hypothetical protein AWB66_05609 [Caballeronia telluris]
MSTHAKTGALQNDADSFKADHDLNKDRTSVERREQASARTWAWASTTEVYDWMDAHTPVTTGAWR